jgi:hypothetical protein
MGCRLAIVLAVLVASGPAAAEPRPAWPSIDEPLPALGGGEADAAVVVGVGDYAFLPDVPGASENAAAWQQWLVRTRGVPVGRVSILRDADATRERIVRQLKKATGDVKPGGTLWFVFVGHGAPAPGGNDGVVLGVDTQQDTDSFGARGVAQQEVQQLVDGGAQGRAVLVFDACFSGTTGDGSQPLVRGVQATIPVRRPATTTKTTTVLSASDSFAGPLPKVGRPAFSYVLLGALRGWGDVDGAVSIDEAFSFTARSLSSALQGERRAPSLRGAPGDLIVRAAARNLDVDAIVLGSCPSSQRWNGSQCEDRCAADSTWNGAVCIAQNVSCPRGMSWDGKRCKPSITCPAGTVFNAGECVAQQIECPEGSSWQDGECRAVEQRTAVVEQPAAVQPPIAVAHSVAGPPPWTWIGAGVGVVGAVAAAGGGFWFYSANSTMSTPSSSGDEKESAATGQVGGIAVAAAGLVVGVGGAAVAVLANPGEDK